MEKGYKQLLVWQKAMDLVTEIYRVTSDFPTSEQFGLTGQLRRAAVSVLSNIAEGHGRLSRKEFRHFLGNARGSLNELETQLEIARRLGWVNESRSNHLGDSVGNGARMLNGLIRSQESTPDA
jgi:four helix bundle protein